MLWFNYGATSELLKLKVFVEDKPMPNPLKAPLSAHMSPKVVNFLASSNGNKKGVVRNSVGVTCGGMTYQLDTRAVVNLDVC
jgi:hypothetical protein